MAAKKASVASTEIGDGKTVQRYLRRMLTDPNCRYVGVAAPFIKVFASRLIATVKERIEDLGPGFKLQVLVSLDVMDYVFGASDPEAIDEILLLCSEFPKQTISLQHLPKLHAKVLVCDWCGIISSANLTYSALESGNFELAAIVKRDDEIEAVRKHFDYLWKQGQIVTEEVWEIRKKQIVRLKKQHGEEIERIREAIRRERVALERMPGDDHQADYYGELLDCLSWINGGKEGMRAPSQLSLHLRRIGDGKTISRALAERRITFMSEVGLIEQNGSHWAVTDRGLELKDDSDSRWRLFVRLLRWCKARGDDQFRVLLQAIEAGTDKATPEISLMDWHNIIFCSDHNGGCEEAATNELAAYNRFRGNSCQARNWLVSLNVLHRESRREFYYSRGSLYHRLTPRGSRKSPINTRLNQVMDKASA